MTDQRPAASGLQQIVPAGLVVALALWVTWVSFAVDDPEPYLFPRLVSLVLLTLSVVLLVRALTGKTVTGAGLDGRTLKNVAPAIAVTLVYVFVLADLVGFYAASTAAFFALVTLYDPAPHDEIETWLKRLAVTVGFMAVIAVLFTLVLKVQVPRGVLF